MREDWRTQFLEGSVPRWLDTFETTPQEAVGALVELRFYHGSLNAAEPRDLLIRWAEILGDSFVEELDSVLAQWIRLHWGRPLGSSTRREADSWILVGDLVSGIQGMKLSGEALRERFRDGVDFLGPLSTSPSRNPYGRYLRAIAHYQVDRSLEPFWNHLCDLLEGVPYYNARYAVEGLVWMPAQPGELDSGLRPEAMHGVARLAAATTRLMEEDSLHKGEYEESFLSVARLAMLWLPFPERWRRELGSRLRHLEAPSRELLEKLMPGLTPGPVHEPNPAWSERRPQIRSGLQRGNASALEAAESLLDEQRRYARSTGEATEFLVRTLCIFSSVASDHFSRPAVAWAQEAMVWEPWDAYTWNILGKALLAGNRAASAVEVGWQAVERFPEDVVTRNTLGNALLKAGHAKVAEAVYREAMEFFPEADTARRGLAETLKHQGRLREAEDVYRWAIEEDSRDRVAWTGLGGVLIEGYREGVGNRLEEARACFEAALEIDPRHRAARSGLLTLERLQQAEQVAQPEPPLYDFREEVNEREVGVGMARLLRRAARKAVPQVAMDLRIQAEELLDKVLDTSGEHLRAQVEKVHLLIDRGELKAAHELVQGLSGSASEPLLAARARAERELARSLGSPLEEAREYLLRDPRQLRSLDHRLRPVTFLQEGRALLAAVDGAVRKKDAAKALDQLRTWVDEQILDLSADTGGFSDWWAKKIAHLALDSQDLRQEIKPETIDRIQDLQAQHSRELDLLEEELCNRHAAIPRPLHLPAVF